MITDSQTNALFLSDLLPKRHANFFVLFAEILERHKINYGLLPNTKDIWAVDYMPIQVAENDFVQFKYDPDYLQTTEYRKTISDVDDICKRINVKSRRPKFTIKLDGGNVIRSADMVILTEKVFSENNHIPKDKLTTELKNCFKTEKLFFIPKQPYDFTGHADGMVRFLDAQTLIINDYSNESKSFQNKFKKAIAKTRLDYLEIPFYPSSDKDSANGCYINYLQMKDIIIMPTFGNKKQDNEALKRFKQLFKRQTIETIECNDIAKQGGVLNCITWNIKSNKNGFTDVDSLKELYTLNDEYLKHNPEAESPLNVSFCLGTVGLIKLFKKANNRKITFSYEKGVLDGLKWKIKE